jgi:hypothetical protein
MKFKFHVGMNLSGCEITEIVDIPDKELENMSDDEMQNFVDKEFLEEWMYDRINFYAERINE